jgi:hypothetical protein
MTLREDLASQSLERRWACAGSVTAFIAAATSSPQASHLFGAICPERGVGAAIIMPTVNTEAMNEHLMEISA